MRWVVYCPTTRRDLRGRDQVLSFETLGQRDGMSVVMDDANEAGVEKAEELFFIDVSPDSANLDRRCISHEGPQPATREDISSMLEARVELFARDAPKECMLTFPPTLCSASRMLVEMLAESHNLQHCTQGKGQTAHIVVFKPDKTKAASRQKQKRSRKSHGQALTCDEALEQPWWNPPELDSTSIDGDGGSSQDSKPRRRQRLEPHRVHRAGPRVPRPCDPPAQALASAPAVALDASHRGHQLLMRLGWAPGDGLGAVGTGALEPLAAYLPMQTTRSGLGFES